MAAEAIRWQWATLDEFSARQWHAIACMRQSVFIIEQSCPFPDLDATDLLSRHLIGWRQDGEPLAALRLVPPGVKFAEPSFGRVVTATAARGCGLGHTLIREAQAEHRRLYPGQPNTIGAQLYLVDFYSVHGFTVIGQQYLEDDILHIDMRWHP